MTDTTEFNYSVDMEGEILGKALSYSGLGKTGFEWLDGESLYDALTEEELAYALNPSRGLAICSLKDKLLKVAVERCLL